MKRRLVSIAVVALASVGLLIGNAEAQRDAGTVTVRVVDTDGFPLPGVTVVVQGPVSGTQTTYSGVDGTARFPSLPAGTYSITLSLQGFKTVIREGVEVSVGRTVSFDVTMELSAVLETIEVEAEGSTVQSFPWNMSLMLLSIYLGLEIARARAARFGRAPRLASRVSWVSLGIVASFVAVVWTPWAEQEWLLLHHLQIAPFWWLITTAALWWTTGRPGTRSRYLVPSAETRARRFVEIGGLRSVFGGIVGGVAGAVAWLVGNTVMGAAVIQFDRSLMMTDGILLAVPDEVFGACATAAVLGIFVGVLVGLESLEDAESRRAAGVTTDAEDHPSPGDLESDDRGGRLRRRIPHLLWLVPGAGVAAMLAMEAWIALEAGSWLYDSLERLGIGSAFADNTVARLEQAIDIGWRFSWWPAVLVGLVGAAIVVFCLLRALAHVARRRPSLFSENETVARVFRYACFGVVLAALVLTG